MKNSSLDNDKAKFGTLRANPYLHLAPDGIFNPHADQTVTRGEAAFALLSELAAKAATDSSEGMVGHDPSLLRLLVADRWIVSDADDPDRWYRIKYVSLEAHTVCNQACDFCPVSVAPRPAHFMPTALYERIVGQIAGLGEPVEAVFMIGYNEATLDPRFLDQVRCLRAASLPPAVLSNGTGLTPDVVDALGDLGGLAYLSINLSTLDAGRYAAARGSAELATVLANLDYLAAHPIAETMDIVVLGSQTESPTHDVEAIRTRFLDSPFEVRGFVSDDRAGYLSNAHPAIPRSAPLRGCDHMGSRPIQHLHVDPHGRCVVCCQDYDGAVVVGDLTRQSVAEVLVGPAMAQARRQIYGLDVAPDDFLCRGCSFARRG